MITKKHGFGCCISYGFKRSFFTLVALVFSAFMFVSCEKAQSSSDDATGALFSKTGTTESIQTDERVLDTLGESADKKGMKTGKTETIWTSVPVLDTFNEPTGKNELKTGEMKGTYNSQNTTNGKLEYSINVSMKGVITFSLFEGGSEKSLTTTANGESGVNQDETYIVSIRTEKGTDLSYKAKIAKNKNDKYCNLVINRDSRSLLIDNDVLKIVIEGPLGSYNLGSVDVSVLVDSVFYEKTKYNDGVALMRNGEYQKALAVFKSITGEPYDYYNVSDKISKCRYELGTLMYNDAVSSMESADYQDAIDKFNKLLSTYPEVYGSLDGEKKVSDCRFELGSRMYKDAVSSMELADYQDALDKFKMLSSTYPEVYGSLEGDYKVSECRYALGNMLFEQIAVCLDKNDNENALVYFEDLRKTYPEVYDAWVESRKILEFQIALGLLHIGDLGPAGGYIFYDCDEDNDSGNADGLISTEVGWRYLEAAPADLRVVNGVPTVDVNATGYSQADVRYIFGCYRASSDGNNLYVNGSTKYNEADCTGTSVGTGKRNTELLVDAMGDSAYSYFSGTEKTSTYAAKLCSDLEYAVDGKTFDDWFLPSVDELDLMFYNLHWRKGLGFAGNFVGSSYWSSSESDTEAYYAWEQDFYDGRQYHFYVGYRFDTYYRVRAVRAF